MKAKDGLGASLSLLEDILDISLHYNEIRFFISVNLEAVTVVPLYHSADLLAVVHDHSHRSFIGHLLEIVEVLGVGLLGRDPLASGRGRGGEDYAVAFRRRL